MIFRIQEDMAWLLSLINLGKLLLAEPQFTGDIVKWFSEDNIVG